MTFKLLIAPYLPPTSQVSCQATKTASGSRSWPLEVRSWPPSQEADLGDWRRGVPQTRAPLLRVMSCFRFSQSAESNPQALDLGLIGVAYPGGGNHEKFLQRRDTHKFHQNSQEFDE